MRSPNRRHDIPLLAKYATAATAKAILSTRTLRWSSPLLFNDPFDVPRDMDFGFTSEGLQAALADRVADYLEGNGSPGSQPGRTLLRALAARTDVPRSTLIEDLRGTLTLASLPSTIALEQLRGAWRDRVPKLRILCFSSLADSPTMWAHYAHDHQGAVLQFESNDERDSCWLLATPVDYRTGPPALPSAHRWARAFLGEEEIDWDEYLREYYYVKAPEWSYESEYRCVSDRKKHETGLYSDYVFHPEDLRSVVLGARITQDDERSLRRLAAQYPCATVYRAQPDYDSRRITSVPL